MNKKIIILIISFAVLTVNSAMAWGGFAHSAITEIAERNLTPQAREKIHYYLNHSLPFYAIWMDQFRYTDPYRPSGKWHSNWIQYGASIFSLPEHRLKQHCPGRPIPISRKFTTMLSGSAPV